MSDKKLKTPDDDSLRGTGFNSMGWSESAKQVKNVKRLMKTFDDTPKNKTSKKNKIEVTCAKCGNTFKTTSGKLPKHQDRWAFKFQRRNLDGTVDAPEFCNGVSVVTEKRETLEYKGDSFKIGDSVLYSVYKRTNKLQELKLLTKDAKIKSITFTNKPSRYGFSASERIIVKFDNDDEYATDNIKDMVKI